MSVLISFCRNWMVCLRLSNARSCASSLLLPFCHGVTRVLRMENETSRAVDREHVDTIYKPNAAHL